MCQSMPHWFAMASLTFCEASNRPDFNAPFEKEWKPREVKSDLGQINKWNHYISRWGGREFDVIAKHAGFDAARLAYFHSMRHTFNITLGDAGVSSEISEALSGRRYGSADAERYEHFKQNHRRLSADGVARGLDVLTALLNKALGAAAADAKNSPH